LSPLTRCHWHSNCLLCCYVHWETPQDFLLGITRSTLATTQLLRISGATWQLKVTGNYSCPEKVSYKSDSFLTMTVYKAKIRKTSNKRNKCKLCPTEHRTWASRSLLQKKTKSYELHEFHVVILWLPEDGYNRFLKKCRSIGTSFGISWK
jgi:hypothetical protein